MENIFNEIESQTVEFEEAIDLLSILFEFVEDEGFQDKNNFDIVKAACFINRLPTFYSLMKAIDQKIVSATKQLNSMVNNEYKETESKVA